MLYVQHHIQKKKQSPPTSEVIQQMKISPKLCSGYVNFVHSAELNNYGHRFVKQSGRTLKVFKVIPGKLVFQKLRRVHEATYDLQQATVGLSKILKTVVIFMDCGNILVLRANSNSQSKCWLNRLSAPALVSAVKPPMPQSSSSSTSIKV